MIEPYGFTREKQEVIDELINEKVEDLVDDHVCFFSIHTKGSAPLTDDATSSTET